MAVYWYLLPKRPIVRSWLSTWKRMILKVSFSDIYLIDLLLYCQIYFLILNWYRLCKMKVSKGWQEWHIHFSLPWVQRVWSLVWLLLTVHGWSFPLKVFPGHSSFSPNIKSNMLSLFLTKDASWHILLCLLLGACIGLCGSEKQA